MKTYKFNTLRGLLRAASGQISAASVFSGRVYLSRGRGLSNIVLSDRARLEAAQLFAAYLVRTPARADMVAALTAGRGDLSLFQCFYFDLTPDGVHVSNSLSGEAFEYCKRRYLRRYC
jgi:hypothetical protein